MKRHLSAAAVAAALVFTATAARADVAFETRLSNVTVGVLDLTPGDGIAAQYQLTGVRSNYTLSVTDRNGKTERVADSTSGANAVDHALTKGPSTAASWSSGDIGEIGVRGTVLHNLGVGGGISATAMQYYTFTLGAYSGLTFSGHLLQQIERLPGSTLYQDGNSLLSIEFSSPDLAQRGYLTKRYSLGAALDDDKDFWLSYLNPTADDITVAVRFSASSSSYISAVPEPATWGMLGAGLLAVGAAARRRARRI